MRYVVYDKKSGEIIRTYRKVIAESGEVVPATDVEILSDLPLKWKRDDVGIVVLPAIAFERGKSYKVDLDTCEIVSSSRTRTGKNK